MSLERKTARDMDRSPFEKPPEMNRFRQLAAHVGILSSRELSVRLLDVVVSVVLARYLAPEGFGLLAFAMAFVALFEIIPMFGMGPMSMRDIAQDPTQLRQYLSNGMVAKVFLSLLTLLVLWMVTAVMRFPAAKTQVVLLAAVWMVLNATVSFVLSFFQASQRMTTTALMSVALRGGWLIAALALVAFHQGLVALLGARVIVTAIGLVVSLALVHSRIQRIRWFVDLTFLVRMLKASLPFAILRLFTVIYMDIDMVMLSMMRGDVMTGWLAAAQKFLRMLGFIPDSFFGAMLPELSRSSRTSHAELGDTLARGCRYLVLIALPIAGGICVTAPRLVRLLYGPAYDAAVPALCVLIWMIPFQFLNSTLRAAIMSVNQERQAGAFVFFGALFNIATNCLAIPRFGHVGAAATTVLTEALIFVLQLRLLRRTLPGLRLWDPGVKPLLAGAAMMAVAWLSREVPLVYTILGSAAIYLGSLLAMGVIGAKGLGAVR